MNRIALVALVGLFALQACNAPPAAPVVVYVPAELEAWALDSLPGSGLEVTVIAGESSALTERVIDKQDAPRADVLITSGVADIWRAADEGALRPFDGTAVNNVPVAFRDPDEAWVAISARPLRIASTMGRPDPALSSFADLGSPELAGKLCLTLSSLPANRALLGMLIDELGVKPAERVVRRWVHNLAAAPFVSEEELVAALESGRCQVAILAADPGHEAWTVFTPEPTCYDIHAVGVARHAQNPQAGQQLVDWILAGSTLPNSADAPVRNIAAAGFFGEEARLLAERAGYR